MHRLIKWFIWPLAAMLASLALLAAGYQTLLQAPVTTITPRKAAQQRANLAASVAATVAQRAKIEDADLRTLLNAQASTASLIQRAGVGRLAIPAADISLPVFNRINDETLSAGVALYYPERRLGQGNTVMAAHNFVGADVLLKQIAGLKVGDTMLVSDLTTVWRYRVAINQVVDASQVSVLADTADARLTLIRCEGARGTRYRRVVVGLLTSATSLKSNSAQAKALHITPTHTRSPRPGLLAWVGQALARTLRFGRLDGWLWGLLLINVALLLGCAAGYVWRD
ncbi:class A sortase [Lacticaseibacillus absianus]|uniref:class A sortase n=1 Tax=Lacticaseibacillus absianus TaxID=2729623 RepID=UPI0015CE3AB2|nr:class A sortase [Lacticaseibacillus absianus]